MLQGHIGLVGADPDYPQVVHPAGDPERRPKADQRQRRVPWTDTSPQVCSHMVQISGVSLNDLYGCVGL